MTTKSELIEKIADKTGFTKKKSESFLNACVEAIEEDLQNGGNLKLTGFGSFKVEHRKEREGRNPQTGEKITIPASRVVKFSPGKELRENIQK